MPSDVFGNADFHGLTVWCRHTLSSEGIELLDLIEPMARITWLYDGPLLGPTCCNTPIGRRSVESGVPGRVTTRQHQVLLEGWTGSSMRPSNRRRTTLVILLPGHATSLSSERLRVTLLVVAAHRCCQRDQRSLLLERQRFSWSTAIGARSSEY